MLETFLYRIALVLNIKLTKKVMLFKGSKCSNGKRGKQIKATDAELNHKGNIDGKVL